MNYPSYWIPGISVKSPSPPFSDPLFSPSPSVSPPDPSPESEPSPLSFSEPVLSPVSS